MNDDVMYTLLADKVVYEEEFPHFVHDTNNLQNVFTPYELCEDVINKITSYTSLKNKSILVFNLEFAIVLLMKGYNKKNITFVTDSISKFVYAKEMVGIESIETDLMKLETVMANRKFDVVIMNPPYQTKADENFKTTKPIWQDFVKLSHEITKENGVIAAIHPSGWRNIKGQYLSTKNLIQSKKIHYLSINNEKEGLKIFKAETRFDWYIIQNTNSDGTVTEIDDETGEKTYLNVSQLPFIPNSNFELINKLVAKDGEEKVEILYSCDYHSQRDHMSKVKNDVFKYPCVWSVDSKGVPTLKYSSINTGHFGVPKLIFSSGRISSANYIVDKNGDYGQTEFAKGIVDSPENLDNIYKAMRTKEFKDIMYSCAVSALEINKSILATFRKDFWKEFV